MDEMLSYSSSRKIIAIIERAEGHATKGLNELQNFIEKKENIDDKAVAEVQQVSTMTGAFVEYLVTNIVKAQSTYRKLMDQSVQKAYA